MKKTMISFIFICMCLILLKFWTSNYTIKYEVAGYDIETVYNNDRFYFEIIKDDKTYNFDLYKKRNISKLLISDIRIIGDDTFSCIYPVINDVKTYPLCYKDNVYMDYTLIDSELLDEYKEVQTSYKPDKDFVYYNNLDSNEYVALWNYNGYIVINGNDYKNIKLFDNEKYDNSLSYIVDNNIYIADYDSNHEFDKLIVFDITNYEKHYIDLGYKIDFDAYIVGHIDNCLYIFDNKHAVLYQVDLKRNKTKIIANNEIGYVKYENGKFVSCSKNEYKVNKIKFNKTNSKYIYKLEDGLYKSFIEDRDIFIKISENNVNMIYEYENELYYLYKDYFYKYTPETGSEKVFYNYELSFNDLNSVFVYVK